MQQARRNSSDRRPFKEGPTVAQLRIWGTICFAGGTFSKSVLIDLVRTQRGSSAGAASPVICLMDPGKMSYSDGGVRHVRSVAAAALVQIDKSTEANRPTDTQPTSTPFP